MTDVTIQLKAVFLDEIKNKHSMGFHEKNRTYNFFFRHLLSQGGRSSVQNPFLARLDTSVLLTSWMISFWPPFFIWSYSRSLSFQSFNPWLYLVRTSLFYSHSLLLFFSSPHEWMQLMILISEYSSSSSLS